MTALAPFADLVVLTGRTPTRQEARTWYTVRPTRVHGVEIPAGFLTDLASIPRWASPWIDRAAWPWIDIGVLHDWRYASQTTTRHAADLEMLDVAADTHAPPLASALMWLAVRAVGWRAWRSRGRDGLAARMIDISRSLMHGQSTLENPLREQRPSS